MFLITDFVSLVKPHWHTWSQCQTAATWVGRAIRKIGINSDGLLVLLLAVNSAIKIVVRPSLHQRILMVSHHPQIAGHPGQRRIYATLRCNFYWPLMTTEVDHIVLTYPSCATTTPSIVIGGNRIASQHLEQSTLSQSTPWDLFPNKAQSNQYILVITVRCFKLTRVV